MHTSKHEATYYGLTAKNFFFFLKEQSGTFVIEVYTHTHTQLLQNSVQTCWITALYLVSWSLVPSMAISIFHCCLVRSWPFTGTRRFPAGLFTFLSS